MMNSRSFVIFLLVVTCGVPLLAPRFASSQQPDSAHTGSSGGSAAGQQQTESAAPGFSIESEMLTYTALERDADAVAKDVAPYLRAGQQGVVILPPNSSVLADFGVWSAAMATMDSFVEQAYNLGYREQLGQSPAISFTPYTSLLPLAQSVLSTTESVSAVRGTVEERAFMSQVARRLRALGIPVIMPDMYLPFSLSGRDSEHFLFLEELKMVDEARSYLRRRLNETKVNENKRPAEDPFGKWDALQGSLLLGEITSFTASEFGGEAGVVLGLETKAPQDRSSTTDGARPGPTVPLASFSHTHLAALLSADLLAQRLVLDSNGYDLEKKIKRSTTGSIQLSSENSRWQHILWVKVLESGGSVIKTGSFLGTKTRYSGGAVGTYALFNLQGDLECAGNVYDHGGPLRTKDFRRTPSPADLDPKINPIVLEGSCAAMTAPETAAPSN